ARIIHNLYEETLKLLSDNKDKLQALAQALLDNEVVEQRHMMEIIGMPLAEAVAEQSNGKGDAKGRHFSLADRDEPEIVEEITTDADILAEESDNDSSDKHEEERHQED